MSDATPPKPPALAPPASSRRGPSSAARSLSDGQKEALVIQALGLLNEQLQARVVHHESQPSTRPEVARDTSAKKSVEEVEEPQIRSLAQLLPRFFAGQAQFAPRLLEPIGKSVTRLFFESELHEQSKAEPDRVIRHPEQGVHAVLTRYKHRLRAELDGFEFQSPEIRQATAELLAKIERDLQLSLLSRRSPELSRVMAIYTGVLGDFLQKYLPSRLEQMAKVTIRVCKSARRPNSLDHKVLSDAFGDFRAEWERLFMQQLVFFCGDELLERVAREDDARQGAMAKFFTDPRVFSETCAVICEALYDFLCLEGFLDLPRAWRDTSPRARPELQS